MIIDTILIQIELSNKDSVVIVPGLSCQATKETARPNTVPSAVGWLSGVWRGRELTPIVWDQYI